MNYNPPYYQSLLENYGFKTYFEQWCYTLYVPDRPDEKFYKRHDDIQKNPDYHAEHIRMVALRNQGRYLGLPTSVAIEQAIFGPLAHGGVVE